MKIKGLIGRAIAVLLTCTMLMPAALNAASFTDSAGHWAETQIEYMVKKKVLSGYPDGTFLPNNPVTRAEFIKMIDDTFGLVGTQGLTYNDVKSTDWYYTYIAKAAKQGYLLDYGRTLNPNEELHREEAAALIARYLELPADEADSKSKFTDYNRIDSDYRDYVLQASYAGLINGYPDGTFGPRNTITRAEALAILSRAAGTIYDATASGLDSAATQGNAVITKPNVTVRQAEIDGNIIITEGANSGSVTLYKCTVDGTLTIRGTAKVVLSECEIDEIIVDTGLKTPSSLTVEDDTVISSIKLVSPAGIDAKDGTAIDELNVTSTATASSVKGDTNLGSLTVSAERFTCDVTPDEYDIADGITATIKGVGTSGDEEDNTGFTKEPTVSIKSSYDYLAFTTSANGYVYYYYTNTATQPTIAEFKSNYSNTKDLKGRFSAKKNTADDEKVQATANTSGYAYMVVCFADSSEKYYKPVVIKRADTASGYGFNGTPTIASVGGYDQFTATPLYKGKILYFYSTSSGSLTSQQFRNSYATASVRNEFTTTANTQVTKNLAVSSNVATYNYLIVMAVDSDGKDYTPVVLQRGTTGIAATSSGFYAAPSASEYMGMDQISFNAISTGSVRYYYTTSPTAPAQDVFNATYEATNSTLKGIISVTTASYNTIHIHSSVRPSQTTYPYIVFMLQASNGTYYTPYVLTRGSTNSPTITGFTMTPTVIAGNGYDALSLTPMYSGNVRIYYTNSSTTPTPAEFEAFYNSNLTSVSRVPYYQQAAVAGQNLDGNFSLTSYGTVNYTHVAFMLTASDGTRYQPVVVARSNTNTSITASGFTSYPTVYASSDYDGKDTINVNVSSQGYVQYYYTNTYYAPTDAATFTSYWYTANAAGVGGQQYLSSYYATLTSTTTSASLTNGGYKYVVFMFTPTSLLSVSTPSTPIIVQRSNMGNSSDNSGSTTTTSSGFSVSPKSTYDRTSGQDYLTFTSSKTCEMYFYYTDSKTSASSSVDFWANYYAADIKGTYDVKAGQDTSRSISSSGISGYNYIMVMLVDGSTSYKPYPVERK